MNAILQENDLTNKAALLQPLIANYLVPGRNANTVPFFEQFLPLVIELGNIRCALVNQEVLGFWLNGKSLCEARLDDAKGKLRMLCARLSVVCDERAGGDHSPYGGDAEFTFENATGKHLIMKIWYINTPGQHEFTIDVRPA